MPISFSTDRVIVPDRVVARVVTGATVLLNAETGQSFLLDPIGSHAWQALTSSGSLQAAYDMLMAEYLVDAAQLKVDLESLIDSLTTRGLLEIQRG